MSAFDDRRQPPHTETIRINTSDVPADTICRRPFETAAIANPAFSNPTKSDSPCTPTTLASCAIGRNVTMVLPSGIHGNPPIRMPRRNSIATHTAGASHRPATRKRRIKIAVIAPNTAM